MLSNSTDYCAEEQMRSSVQFVYNFVHSSRPYQTSNDLYYNYRSCHFLLGSQQISPLIIILWLQNVEYFWVDLGPGLAPPNSLCIRIGHQRSHLPHFPLMLYSIVIENTFMLAISFAPIPLDSLLPFRYFGPRTHRLHSLPCASNTLGHSTVAASGLRDNPSSPASGPRLVSSTCV